MSHLSHFRRGIETWSRVSSRCIVALGINGPIPSDHPKVLFQDFPAGLTHIRADITKIGYTGALMLWDRDYPAGSPAQEEAHGAFKPFCFREAGDAGYTEVMWLDASIRIKVSLEPLFDIIQKRGYLIFEEAHTVGEYCSDKALLPLGITREESFALRSCWSCVFGLNLSNPRAQLFLSKWQELASDGITFPGPKWSGVKGWPPVASTDPRVKGHRYDQTAASVIAHHLDMCLWEKRSTFMHFFENDRLAVRRLQEWKR